MKQPSAARNIIKRIERLLSISFILLILATLIITITTILANQKIKSYFTKQQEIQTFIRSQENTNELLDYVETNKEIVSQIETVFPNETNIDISYQTILSAAKEVDDNAQLKIKANLPTTHNGKSILPMELVASTNTAGTISLLRRIERLPYIIEVSTIEMQNPLTTEGTTTILFRLYVDNEFVKS